VSVSLIEEETKYPSGFEWKWVGCLELRNRSKPYLILAHSLNSPFTGNQPSLDLFVSSFLLHLKNQLFIVSKRTHIPASFHPIA
jgi:hypothetical protein